MVWCMHMTDRRSRESRGHRRRPTTWRSNSAPDGRSRAALVRAAVRSWIAPLLLALGACAAQEVASISTPLLTAEDFPVTGPRPIAPPAADPAVRIDPDDDALAVVAAERAGTTFVFAPGVHRLKEAIEPDDGDRFVGLDGAVLSGARLLTTASREGGHWAVGNQTQMIDPTGECLHHAPRCGRPEQLFIDDRPLRHVSELDDVDDGTWFFDYEADTIWFEDDPRGRRIETSVARAAFAGDADDVTIENLVIEKFGSRAQHGAIHAYGDGGAGERWTIRHNEVRLNHGIGIHAGHGARILRNRVHRNGQLGMGSNGGRGTLIEGNEIAHNNTAGFDHSWEAGGTKFVDTRDLVVRGNHVHHNEGPGLWTDIDNIGTLYEGNLVTDNLHTGIFHEISYEATIRSNTVLDNGYGRGYEGDCYVHCAGILVYASPDVTVHDNTVLGNWNGITGRYGGRGEGAHGPYLLTNLHVHDNTIELPFHEDGVGPGGHRGVAALAGVVQDDGLDAFTAAAANRFERNAYLLERDLHFAWLGAVRTWDEWRACGGAAGRELWPGCGQDRDGRLLRGTAPQR